MRIDRQKWRYQPEKKASPPKSRRLYPPWNYWISVYNFFISQTYSAEDRTWIFNWNTRSVVKPKPSTWCSVFVYIGNRTEKKSPKNWLFEGTFKFRRRISGSWYVISVGTTSWPPCWLRCVVSSKTNPVVWHLLIAKHALLFYYVAAVGSVIENRIICRRNARKAKSLQGPWA